VSVGEFNARTVLERYPEISEDQTLSTCCCHQHEVRCDRTDLGTGLGAVTAQYSVRPGMIFAHARVCTHHHFHGSEPD
jgi:hypothetical protein